MFPQVPPLPPVPPAKGTPVRTRITKVLTIAATSAALLGGAALATAGTAVAAPAHAGRAVRVAPHHVAVRTERVWVKGHYVTVRVRGHVRREWIPAHYETIVVHGR